MIAGPENRIGVPGAIVVGIQCGCGWSVLVTSTDGEEAHYDLFDRANELLKTHVREKPGSIDCQPWAWR